MHTKIILIFYLKYDFFKSRGLDYHLVLKNKNTKCLTNAKNILCRPKWKSYAVFINNTA